MKPNIEEMTKDIVAIGDEITALKKKAAELGQEKFNQACKEIFNYWPKLKSFSWTQYTPYFCDGDPCEFSVNNEYCDWEYEDCESEEISDWSVNREQTFSEDAKECAQTILKLLGTLSEDIFLDIFGDHAKVEVTAEGIEIESYDHD